MKDGGYDVEYRVVRPDGSIRWVRDRAFPVSDEYGRVVRIAGIAADITDARTRDAQLNRAERLAAVGTLIGGVAHELNNPLQSIRGFADLLLESAQNDEDREALTTIAREARRAARIVSELRRVARSSHQETGPREPVDLNDIVRHVMKTQAYSLASANVFISLDLARALPQINADPSRIEQVVLNLVVNAGQALAARDTGRRIIVRTRRTRAGCSLAVYDNGPGIESGHMPRLFDPFWTTKGPDKGTGLGLSVVHQIVTEHGGTVHVDSEPGRGTNFLVELPLGENWEPASGNAAGAAGARGVPQAGAQPRQLRILVVDDEEPLRRMLARIGTRRGHVVDTASEGREALEMVRAAEADRPYDIVFSDLHMPGMSGRQFTEQLLAHDASYEDRFFVFTGAMDTSDIAWIREHTSVPIMHKPFSISDVAAVLMEYEQRVADGPDAAAQGPEPSPVD
jgi:two-component system, NtrC family, sensor kinase